MNGHPSAMAGFLLSKATYTDGGENLSNKRLGWVRQFPDETERMCSLGGADTINYKAIQHQSQPSSQLITSI